MALNWDDYLNSECYAVPNNQLNTPSSGDPIYDSQAFNIMTNNPSDWTAACGPRASTLFDPSAAFQSADDPVSISNDAFLKNFEVMQAFEDSQSPSDSLASTCKHSTQGSASPLERTDILRELPQDQRQSSADGAVSSFPDSIELDFSKDFTFLNKLPEMSSKDLERLLNPTHTSGKRQKSPPDIMSACWTSPLCPNNDQNGPPPNPATCNSGCAPFLFANEDALPTTSIEQLLPQPQEIVLEDEETEIQPRPMKRSESDASLEGETGRQTLVEESSTSPVDTEPRRAIRQPKQTSSNQPTQTKDSAKPSKVSRRLPHNQVERKYRESLNSQLDNLRKAVPALQQPQNMCDSNPDIEDVNMPSKPSKAVILASATAYIKQMEQEKKMLLAQIMLLRSRIKAPQAGVKCEDCSLMQYVSNLNLGQAK